MSGDAPISSPARPPWRHRETPDGWAAEVGTSAPPASVGTTGCLGPTAAMRSRPGPWTPSTTDGPQDVVPSQEQRALSAWPRG